MKQPVRWKGDKFEGFVCLYWFNGWEHLSFGVSIYLTKSPNIEIHLPGGFVKIGWTELCYCEEPVKHVFGFWTDTMSEEELECRAQEALENE